MSLRDSKSVVRHITALATVVSLLAYGAPALAAPTPEPDPTSDEDRAAQAQAFEDAAVQAFEEERYEDAVENFKQAFRLDDNPNNFFNIGRVFEEQGDLESAVEYYKLFLARPGVSLEGRKRALERIEVLEKTLATMRVDEPSPSAVPSQDVVNPPPATNLATSDATDAPRPGRKQRIAGVTTLGVGAAVLAAGGVVGGLTLGINDEYENAETLAARQDAADRGNTMTTTADVLYAVGGTLAVIGLTVALSAQRRAKRRDPKTALAPTLSPRGGGVVLRRRF